MYLFTVEKESNGDSYKLEEVPQTSEKSVLTSASLRSRLNPELQLFVFNPPSNFKIMQEYLAGTAEEVAKVLFLTLSEARKKEVFMKIDG